MNWLRLDTQLALVTGVGSRTGIGFATAQALWELGARLFITSNSPRSGREFSPLLKVVFLGG